jgi:hypothetical protein
MRRFVLRRCADGRPGREPHCHLQPRPKRGVHGLDLGRRADRRGHGDPPGVSVTLSGSHISPRPGSNLDETSNFFAESWFNPSLAQIDHIEIHGFQRYSYMLSSADPGSPTPSSTWPPWPRFFQ